jgi:outer membrane receptor protein involved in Fe transport
MYRVFGVTTRTALVGGVLFAFFQISDARAQDAQTSDELIVYGTVVTRNRTDSISPKLSYDVEYFQRFEPISAGDALKRVPGVSFSSDMLEYDQVQLRGLPSIYAQVQVNGQNMTGAGNDRVFFVDRIPAELIDSIEVIRSPSADMSSEGIGGTVNANLKRAGQIKGGWVRGSGFGVEDDELRGAGSVGYGNTIGDTSYLFSADVQQRRNPKYKTSEVFTPDGELDGFETQSDTRDGTDYALNGEVAQKVGDGLLRLYGFYVLTDRDEDEWTEAFEIDNGKVGSLEEIEKQHEGIVQQNMSIVGDYKVPVGKDEAQVLFGYNRFVDNLDTEEHGADVGNPFKLNEVEHVDTLDQDWFGTLAYAANFNAMVSVKVGVDGRIKTRDFRQQVLDEGIDDITPPNGVFDIEERRVDPYVKATWNFLPGLSVETGLRYEYTDREMSGTDFSGDSTEDQLNPSAHLRYSLTDTTMLRFSVARTVLRPSFDMLTPGTLAEEPTDDTATRGNPNLKQETAWGIDAGFDQKLGDRGIFGFNVFNREIKDKIELEGSAQPSGVDCDNGDPCQLLIYNNLGDARAWGIEVDVDVPLTVLGLPDTSIFANYTWLQSELVDPVTGEKRRFRDQPDYVYNIGLIQNLPSWNSTFGVSYQKRGESLAYDYAEIQKLSYQGNLEAFWETRLSKSTVLRFTGANLLDAEKYEKVDSYKDSIASGELDETEIEREKSGRLFLMTVRQAF